MRSTTFLIADFFDISIDVLLGYEMKDNRKETVLKRIIKSLGQKDMNGLAEAEKALKKYPNIFDIVYCILEWDYVYDFRNGGK